MRTSKEPSYYVNDSRLGRKLEPGFTRINPDDPAFGELLRTFRNTALTTNEAQDQLDQSFSPNILASLRLINLAYIENLENEDRKYLYRTSLSPMDQLVTYEPLMYTPYNPNLFPATAISLNRKQCTAKSRIIGTSRAAFNGKYEVFFAYSGGDQDIPEIVTEVEGVYYDRPYDQVGTVAIVCANRLRKDAHVNPIISLESHTNKPIDLGAILDTIPPSIRRIMELSSINFIRSYLATA